MKNYEAVAQWAATLNADAAYQEIARITQKHPWIRLDKSFEFIEKMRSDLPKIQEIVKQQEKQNAIHREFVRVSQMADAAIVTAVASKAGIEL
jgi:hypothetical protein